MTQQQVEATLRPFGFTGSATGGAAQAFINANPAAQKAMAGAASNTPKLGQAGYIAPNAPRYDMNEVNRIKAQQQALKGTTAWVPDPKTGVLPDGTYPAGQEWRAAAGGRNTTQGANTTAQAAPIQGGGIPLSAEPLHQWEQTALSRMANPGAMGGGGMEQGQQLLKDFAANPQQFISRFTNPMATQYLQQAGQAFTGANAPVTGEEIQARMNPFQQQVIDTSLQQLSSSGAKARAALLKNLGTRGAAGFGSTVTGTQLGELERGQIRDAATLGANLRYQGFNDATGQVNAERNRGIQVGQGFGNLGTQAQGVTTAAAGLGTGTAGALFDTGNIRTNQGYNTLDRMLGAGKYVRDYNQGLATAAEQEMMDAQNFPMTQAQNVLNLLQGVRSGATPTIPATFTPSRTGAVLSAIPDIIKWLS